MSFYSIAVLSFFVFFCHIMKNIHQDDVSDSKVIKKIKYQSLAVYTASVFFKIFHRHIIHD